MPFSGLQKYILLKGLENKKHSVPKKILAKFYVGRKNSPKNSDQTDIITKSAERLIKKGLAKGVGVKTAEKWFVSELIITRPGIKVAKDFLGKQQKLPFNK